MSTFASTFCLSRSQVVQPVPSLLRTKLVTISVTDLERLTQRVDQLEGVVRALYPVVQRLRAEVGVLTEQGSAGPSPDASTTSSGPYDAAVSEPASPPIPTPARAPDTVRNADMTRPPPAPSRPPGIATHQLDLEAVVGRYGTLALATMCILFGVGAFVRWAIARGFLGPAVRVALGLIAAAGVAGIGLRLRRHGAQRFGHILLALALAIVHVDAWGAGPMLDLVSSPVALGAAAIASASLAWLALVDAEPAIFSVGVGGALLAPFVTATQEPHVVALLAFGYLVIAISVWAVRDRGWAIPVAILALGSIVYAGAAAHVPQRDWEAPVAFLPSAFALACAGTAMFVLPPPHRSTLAQGALAALWSALGVLTAHGSIASGVVGGAALGTILAYATVPRLGGAAVRTLLGACLLPLALLGDALWVVPPVSVDRALVMAGWGVGAVIAAVVYSGLQSRGAAGATDASLDIGRSLAIAIAGLEGGAALVIACGERHPVLATVLLAMYSAVLAVVAAQRAWPSALLPIFVGLGAAALWSWALLAARVNFTYLPFLTRPSVAAAATVAGWGVAAAMLGRAHWLQPASRPTVAASESDAVLRALRLMPAVLLFLWARQELLGVVSSEVATCLLIAYYAAAGVTAVYVGRVRANRPLRHAGLAIAAYAALKTFGEAWQLSVALRIVSYLSAGIFLLAVAYWYRALDGREPIER
jgi:uncharacterized membrane protein